MVWFVGFTVCGFLMLPEVRWQAVDTSGNSVLPILALAAFSPMLAMLQQLRLQHEWRPHYENADARWASIDKRRRLALGVTLAMWFVCCAVAFLLFGWASVVRETWGLGRVPLMDEFLLATPWLIGAILVQCLLGPGFASRFRKIPDSAPEASPPRTELRVFIGLVAVPVAALFLVRDLVSFGVPEGLKMIVVPATAIVTLLVIVALYPLIVSLTWRTRRLADRDLEQQLHNLAGRHGISLAGIRCWETGGLLVNAVVVGLIPGTRTVLLTDALLRQFSRTEIECIFRHELGHLSARHLWWRLAALLSPVAFIGACGWSWQWLVSGSGAVTASAFVAASLAMVAGLVCLWRLWIGPFCRSCEMVADRYAVTDTNGGICRDWLDAYRSALMKFAIANPASYTRPSLLHPSLRERIRCLDELVPVNEVPANEQGKQPDNDGLAEPVLLPFPTA